MDWERPRNTAIHSCEQTKGHGAPAYHKLHRVIRQNKSPPFPPASANSCCNNSGCGGLPNKPTKLVLVGLSSSLVSAHTPSRG